MKKTYGVAPIDQKEYVESAAAAGGSSAVVVPLVKFDGINAQLISGEFELPPAKERQDATLEVAHRILGILVTNDLMAHLPNNITKEHVGTLLPFFPFAFHKRFGKTYSDRVCPGSTRSGSCQICAGRRELFGGDTYKNHPQQKEFKKSIMKAGFGTKNVALVISRVYFDGEDLGIRCWTTNLTNEQALNAKKDNFFDLIAQLMTPKKLNAGETLPPDYYSNGDGARWLFVEYTRAMYSDEGDGDAKSKRPPAPYWKLSKITPAKELEGMGKASAIWWPEHGKGKDAKDGCELADIYSLINHSPAEVMAEAAEQAVEFLLNPRKAGEKADEQGGGQAAEEPEQLDAPSWNDILAMEIDELVRYGVAKGGKARDLELAGTANPAALKRTVAKLWGITPRAVTAAAQAPADEPPLGEGGEELDPTPF